MRLFGGVLLAVSATILLAVPPAAAQCDLYTQATDSIDPAMPGDVVTYTVTVGNLGPNASAAQVTLNMQLPPGVGPNLQDYLAGLPDAVAAFQALFDSLSIDPEIWHDGLSATYVGPDSYCEAIYLQVQNLDLPPMAEGNIYYSVPMPTIAYEKVFRFDSASLDLDLLPNSGLGGCSSYEDCTGIPCMGPRIGAIPLTSAELELVDDGMGGSIGCTPPVGFTPGNAALIDRGECAFELKAALAVNPDGDPTTDDGAVIVIIADHDDFTDSTVDPYDIIPNMACTDFCSQEIIPAPTMFISWADGQDIHAVLDAGETVTVSIGLQNSDGVLSSTGFVWEFAGTATDSDDTNDWYVETTSILASDLTPAAGLELSPAQAWPGDAVTISDASAGYVQRRAIWVTDGPGPDDPVVGGSPVLAADVPTTLLFTVPLNLAQAQDFYAHVAVENDDNPYLGDATPTQLATVPIEVDREPQVNIVMSPELPLSGEVLTLSAIYEGNPSHPASGPSVLWSVVGPDPPPASDTGDTIVVLLAQSGIWTIDVTVYYRHEAADGSRYVATARQVVHASSVQAFFSFLQSPLVSSDQITMDASATRFGPGALPSYQWQVTGATNYDGCPAGATAVLCDIPPSTLDPGLHDFQLTVTNTTNGDVSIYQREEVPVIDGAINPTISWSPVNPSIGELVTFTLLGVPDELDAVLWSLGGNSCAGDGFIDPSSCSLPDADGCTQLEYRYGLGGMHDVSVILEDAGISYGPVNEILYVSDSGSCLHGIPSMWEKVVEDGFDVPGNTIIESMAVLGDSIFAGTRNEVEGCEVWSSSDGTDWQQTAVGGFAAPANVVAVAMAVFGEELFVGTANAVGGGELWKWVPGSGWSIVSGGGLGDPDNVELTALQEHAGALFVGTANQVTGGQVWRMGAGGEWAQIGPSGMGSIDNDAITELLSFNGTLYAASTGFWGFRLWQLADPDSWLQVGADGFGDNFNVSVSAMAQTFGSVTLGTENHNDGTEIWQSDDGDSWVQLSWGGFGRSVVNEMATFVAPYADEFYVGTSNWQSGSEVWRSDPNEAWVETSHNGFGDQYNVTTPATAVFKGALYVGTENPYGGQVWRLNTTLLFDDGFEAGDVGAWSTAVN